MTAIAQAAFNDSNPLTRVPGTELCEWRPASSVFKRLTLGAWLQSVRTGGRRQ